MNQAMSEDTSRAAEDLALIRRLMEDTQGVMRESGGHFMVWGALMTTALLTTWADVQGVVSIELTWIWLVAVGLGWIYSFGRGWRSHRSRRVTTLGGRVIMGIWVGHGIALTLLAFLGIGSGAIDPVVVNPVFGAVFGAACFATSFVTRQGWLRWSAGLWWAASGVMLLWSGPYTYLLTAGLLLGLVVLPAAVSRARASDRRARSAA